MNDEELQAAINWDNFRDNAARIWREEERAREETASIRRLREQLVMDRSELEELQRAYEENMRRHLPHTVTLKPKTEQVLAEEQVADMEMKEPCQADNFSVMAVLNGNTLSDTSFNILSYLSVEASKAGVKEFNILLI